MIGKNSDQKIKKKCVNKRKNESKEKREARKKGKNVKK